METGNLQFEEKQYLGSNRMSVIIRTLFILFCFIGYYWSQNPKPVEVGFIHIGSYPIHSIDGSGQMFFILGVLLTIISGILIYVMHLHTRVYKDHILLDGFWRARRVKIDLNNIVSVKKFRLKKGTLVSPAYNLHRKGVIRFFSGSKELIELKDKDGLVYRIGSQRAGELHKILSQMVKKG
ncbi:MAG: hypothetical protein IAF38_07250 [Bacteroidia bacterium]|nr:hypothetical protein [Bacteroidia bacterium]